MKAIRHLVGVLLGGFGCLFVLGGIGFFFDPDPEIPIWMVVVLLLLLGLLPLGLAFVLLRPSFNTPNKRCPKCGGTEQQQAGVLRSSHNEWIFFFAGWFFSSLWGASRKKQVRCAACETLYFTETRGSRIAAVALWILILMLLFAVIAQLVFGES